MRFGATPFLHFIWVSPRLEEKIKKSSIRGGVLSIIAAPVLGILVLTMDGDLIFTKVLQGAAAFMLFGVGLYLWSGHSCVSSGHVNLTIASQARRPILGLVIFEAILLLLSYLAIWVQLTADSEVSTTSIIFAIILPFPLLGLALMNYFTARKLLPPQPAVLREYGLSGQVISPSFSPGQPFG